MAGGFAGLAGGDGDGKKRGSGGRFVAGALALKKQKKVVEEREEEIPPLYGESDDDESGSQVL